MTNNRAEYDNIDNKLPIATESIYLNPIFDGHDQV
jgi:hypothetical protein